MTVKCDIFDARFKHVVNDSFRMYAEIVHTIKHGATRDMAKRFISNKKNTGLWPAKTNDAVDSFSIRLSIST